MSLLDYPEPQALLNDADVIFPTVKDCAERLIKFFPRYLPKFYHVEQRAKPTLVIRSLISGLECKTREPIAIQAGLPRKPIRSSSARASGTTRLSWPCYTTWKNRA
jgi:hypothetical protein